MIFNSTFSDNLAQSLAKHLIDQYGTHSFELAQIQIILPTKRAVKTLKDAFIELTKNQAMLLPQLTSLYDLEALNPNIPTAIDPVERLMILAKLCKAKPNVQTFDKAIQIAMSLTELLDLVYQYDLNLSNLSELVPVEQFAEHWQETVQFLDILHTYWPQVLAERNKIDPTERKIYLIRELTNRLDYIKTPIIFAGFDGGFPALNNLLIKASKNKKNWIVFNGILDQENLVISKSLNSLYNNMGKPDFSYLTQYKTPQEDFAIQALSQDTWLDTYLTENNLQNIKLIVADTLQNEALTIALLLRKTLETPHKTAALVTTDRTLARQVILQMKRWGIQLDDSAGTPLNHTPVGIFLQLLTDVALHPDGQHYLALLKSPLTADYQNPALFRQQVKQAEHCLRKNQKNWKFDLKTNMDTWVNLFQNNMLIPFKEILSQHICVAENLATSHDRSGSMRLWSDDAGETTLELLNSLMMYADIIGEIEPATYPKILQLMMQQVNIRPKYGMHPRLDILGPIEARLHHPDVCIIGGLNEGVFPPIPETGPWLNRTMRKQLGLPLPETKTSELTMDFLHCICASQVYLTRSKKVDGTPTIPSRYLERLKAVAEINHLNFPEYNAHLAELLDLPDTFVRLERPSPKPPLEHRPTHLSVTRIELWRRNPYAIYARYILNLLPLSPLEQLTKSAIFGTLTHTILDTFFKSYPTSTNLDDLLTVARTYFDNSMLSPGEKVFFWTKFEKIAQFIIDTQTQLLPLIDKTLTEKTISTTLDIDGKNFTLSGTADRIDILKNGNIRIIDYKTQSATPAIKEVLAGYSPQLTLEALLVQDKGYTLPKHPISDLTYWSLDGKKNGGKIVSIQKDCQEIDDLIQKTRQGLIELIKAFNDPDTPYEVCPVASEAPTYNDYEHLSRIKEWSVETEES